MKTRYVTLPSQEGVGEDVWITTTSGGYPSLQETKHTEKTMNTEKEIPRLKGDMGDYLDSKSKVADCIRGQMNTAYKFTDKEPSKYDYPILIGDGEDWFKLNAGWDSGSYEGFVFWVHAPALPKEPDSNLSKVKKILYDHCTPHPDEATEALQGAGLLMPDEPVYILTNEVDEEHDTYISAAGITYYSSLTSQYLPEKVYFKQINAQ